MRKFGEFRRSRRRKSRQARKWTVIILAVALLIALTTGWTGVASWYDMSYQRTASGEILYPDSWTAAHKSYPFGTELTVCYQGNCVHNVRVIDRGPYYGGRDLDLHVAPAEDLGLIGPGVDLVRYHAEIEGHWDGVYYSTAGNNKWVNY